MRCGDKGEGVRTRRVFKAGDVICDYHGILVKAKEGEQIHKDKNSVYSMFFKYDGVRYMIDAEDAPCDCHADTESSFGRKINHSSSPKRVNLRGVPFRYDGKITMLFKALRDIEYDEELFYDYGVRKAHDGTVIPWLSM